LGGGHLINLYDSSPHKLLSGLFPEYDWLPWRLSPLNFWNDKKNQRKFMDWVAKELSITDMSDWFKVTNKVRVRVVISNS
jgi:hypothetical protein